LDTKPITAVVGLTRDSVRGFNARNGLDGNAKVVSLNVEETALKNAAGSGWGDHPQEQHKNESAIYKYTCPYCGKEFNSYGNKKRKLQPRLLHKIEILA
jgi:hypothetical protein